MSLLVFDYPKFQEFIFNTLQSRNVSAKSAGSKVDISEKCAESFLRTFAPKISHVQIFLKLWLEVENDKIILKT